MSDEDLNIKNSFREEAEETDNLKLPTLSKAYQHIPDNFLVILPDTLKRVITSLSHQIPKDAVIYGVPRGGIFIATQLLYLRPDLKSVFYISEEDTSVIVVDDIADTGATLDQGYPGNPYATAFLREGCIVKPEFVGVVIRSTAWLIFPWEMETLVLP